MPILDGSARKLITVEFFAVERFRQPEPMTPEARIFDTIAFVAGRRSTVPGGLPHR
jgi:hypothetical protein